jgi:hypothetical protein
MTASTTSLVVASATGFAVGKHLKIDSEYMEIQAVAGTKIDVRRGCNGSAALAHASGAAVVLAGNAGADFNAINLASGPEVFTYGASGAITVRPGKHIILGGAARAMTLALPALDQDGMELVIIGGSAQAHTVTSTGGFNAGGTASDVATSQGAIGETLHLIASGGYWHVDPDSTTFALA